MKDIKYKFVSGLELDGDYFNGAIKELMTLPYGLDKAGPNILVGLFNKLKSTTSKAQYFHSFKQASSYLMAHRNGTEKLFIEDIGTEGKKMFKVTSTRTMETDYFTNIIYHLILDIEAIELHKLAELVKENKGHVTFLNTDCVECWFNEDNPFDITRHYWDSEKQIPKYKFEEKDESPKYERMKKYKCKESFWIDNIKWNVTNDPENNEFGPLTPQILETEQSINIDGIAGSGKTTMLRNLMEKLNEKKKGFAVLAPTNKACRNLGKEALTIHKFLGGSMRDTKTLKRQIEGKDYIIVDDISMVKEVFYSFIFEKIKTHLEIHHCW